MQFEMGISTSLYLPASGTAGFARSRVRGNNRLPAPPPMITHSTLLVETDCSTTRAIRRLYTPCHCRNASLTDCNPRAVSPADTFPRVCSLCALQTRPVRVTHGSRRNLLLLIKPGRTQLHRFNECCGSRSQKQRVNLVPACQYGMPSDGYTKIWKKTAIEKAGPGSFLARITREKLQKKIF